MTDDDGYTGPAVLIADEEEFEVTVSLTGHFDPITGSYSWYGRVGASPQVAALAGAGRVVLRTPHAEVETMLSDVDPWGRPRVAGFGTVPFAVLTTLPD